MIRKIKFLLGLFLVCLFPLTSSEIKAEEFNPTFSSIDLGKIVITGSRVEQAYKKCTQNISVFSEEDIEESRAGEISEVLDLLPAVDILEYGSLGSTRSIYIRGASPKQVLILIDGRPIMSPGDGQVDFNEISLSNIERIEVLRGPASSMYGSSAVGGVVNIVTKRGTEKMQTEFTTKFGSFATKQVSLSHGYKIDDFDYFLSYDYLASHGHRDNSNYLSNAVNTKLGYQINQDHRLQFSGGYYNSELGIPGKLSWHTNNRKQESFDRYVDFAYQGKVLDGQELSLKLFHNIDRLEYYNTITPLDKETNQCKLYGIDSHYSHSFSDNFRLGFGFTHQNNKINSSTTRKHSYHFEGLYLESEIDLWDRLNLKSGLRLDDYSTFGDYLSPSVSLSFWLTKKVKLHSLAAKSFRAPTLYDLYWPWQDLEEYTQEGNPDLSPEKAISFEAGITNYFSDKFKLGLTLFKTKYKGLIDWAHDAAEHHTPENVAAAVTEGAELEAEFILRDRLKANFNYTYLEAKNLSTKKWLTYRPRHLYKLRLLYSPFCWEMGVSASYKTKVFDNKTNTRSLKHYFIMDLDFSYKISDNTKLFFEIKNLFDLNYQEKYDYSMPGRALYGGVKLTFQVSYYFFIQLT